jgi:hypothetical protein
MPLLSRTAVRTGTTFYALSLLAIFCTDPSAAEPMTFAQVGPHSEAQACRHSCARRFHNCLYQSGGEAGRSKCEPQYSSCKGHCPRVGS